MLQARTAASQAQLDLQTFEGNIQTTRGALALALGLPANLPYDIDSTITARAVAPLADSVDALIASALKGRPDLAAARSQAEAARAGIGEARSSLLPSLNLNGTTGRTYATSIPNGANSYNLALGLSIPLFNGFSRQYDLRAAQFEADAASARTEVLRQQVVYEVFSAYYALQTSTRRVHTAEDLVASAQQSNEVALARYKAGVGSVLDLLAAQTALANARAQYVDARLSWSVSLAQLAHDAGVLDPKGGTSLRLPTPPRYDPTPRRCHPDDFDPPALTADRVVSSCLLREEGHAQAPPVPVTVGTVATRSVPYELAATGTVEPIQTVAVQAQVSGPIVQVAFREGQDVKKGQVLFELDPRPFQAALKQAEGLLARDHATAANAAEQAKRYSTLAEKEYVTAEQNDAARSGAAAATATVAASQAAVDQARLNLQYATIRAPISGRTGSLRVREGNLVRVDGSTRRWSPSTRSGRSSSDSRCRRATSAPSSGTGAPGSPCWRRPRAAGSGSEGTLAFVDNAVDTTTGTILLKGSFPNTDGVLWPGEFVNVRVRLFVDQNALVVPAAAVVSGQQGSFVFVIQPDSTAATRPVKVDRTAGDVSIVSGDIKPGDRVVTDGQLRLRQGSKVQIKVRGDSTRAGAS